MTFDLCQTGSALFYILTGFDLCRCWNLEMVTDTVGFPNLKLDRRLFQRIFIVCRSYYSTQSDFQITAHVVWISAEPRIQQEVGALNAQAALCHMVQIKQQSPKIYKILQQTKKNAENAWLGFSLVGRGEKAGMPGVECVVSRRAPWRRSRWQRGLRLPMLLATLFIFMMIFVISSNRHELVLNYSISFGRTFDKSSTALINVPQVFIDWQCLWTSLNDVLCHITSCSIKKACFLGCIFLKWLRWALPSELVIL